MNIHFVFEPQPDITAFELALCLPLINYRDENSFEGIANPLD